MEDIPEDLSPDLEWMLLGAQASDFLVLETLIEEYYPQSYHIALSILDNPEQAVGAVLESLVEVVRTRHHYRDGLPIKLFVFGRVVQRSTRMYSRQKLARVLPRILHRDHHEGGGDVNLYIPPDGRLMAILARIPLRNRLPYLLYAVHRMTFPEIAWLLQTSERSVHRRINKVIIQLSRGISSDAPVQDSEYRNFTLALEARWSQVHFNADQLEELASFAAELYIRKQHSNHLQGKTIHIALGASALAFVLFLWWATNRIASRETPFPLAARTVIVTQIVSIPVYITPTPQVKASPEPLTIRSSPTDIYQRILESPGSWNTLWAEAQVFLSGLPGNYLPPLIRREQIWISDPQSVLFLSGSLSGNVNKVWVSPQSDFYSIDEDGFPYVEDQPSGWFQDNLLNSFYILLPQDWVLKQEPIKVIGADKLLKRDVLIVDSRSEDGRFSSRMWIDANLGIILRLCLYTEGGNRLVGDVYLTSLEIDKDFDPMIFQPDQMPTYFVEDYRALVTDAQSDGQTNEFFPAERNQPYPRITPPPAFDPVRSDLFMQWSQPQSGTSDQLKMVGVNVFASGYYLGQISVANPWNALCERSPDGRYLAIVEQPDQASIFSSRLQWLEVSDLAQVDEALPRGSRYGNDFAFSPDSKSLAFWGCREQADSCGVYILNLTSGELQNILPGRFSGYFIWSPDGTQLAFSRSDQQLMVINVEHSDIIYTGVIDWTDLKLPEDAPLTAWNVEYPPRQVDLQRCSQPGG